VFNDFPAKEDVGDGQAAVDLLADIIDQPGGQPAAQATDRPADQPPFAVYGDCAYGAGEVLARLQPAGVDVKCKVQAPVAPAAGSPRISSASTCPRRRSPARPGSPCPSDGGRP
jgi:hypothetical protein